MGSSMLYVLVAKPGKSEHTHNQQIMNGPSSQAACELSKFLAFFLNEPYILPYKIPYTTPFKESSLDYGSCRYVQAAEYPGAKKVYL